MKWLVKLLGFTYVTLCMQMPEDWRRKVVFNVPRRQVPEIGDTIKYDGCTWKVCDIGYYADGTPRVSLVLKGE